MFSRLARALALDAGVEENRERREVDEGDLSFLWTYLVPRAANPGAGTLLAVIEACRDRGLQWTKTAAGYTVYPADITDAEVSYADDIEAAVHLATRGGGIMLKRGCDTLALIADPHGAVRRQIADRAKLEDLVAVGEYSVWMPVLDADEPCEELEQLAAGVSADLEASLSPEYGYSVGRADLPEIGQRWCVHTEVRENAMPSEIFWYQYFSPSYASRLALGDFRNVGFRLVKRAHGGVSAQLDDTPSCCVEMVETVRELWPHRLTPRCVS